MKRRIVSILLLISLILLPVSGVYIHLTHDNPTHPWLHIHVFIGVIFTVCGVLHIIWNWKVFKRYFTGK